MSDQFYETYAVYSQVVAAVLFAVAMVYIWIKYIAPAVVTAQARKNNEIADAEQRRDAAKAEVATAQVELTAAGSDATSIRARSERDAAALRERLVAEAEAEGRRVVHNADGELARARVSAREALRAELIERAVAIARESAGRLDDSTNRRVVGDVVRTVAGDGA